MSESGPFGGGGGPLEDLLRNLARLLTSQGPVNWEVGRQLALWTATEGEPENNPDPLARVRLDELLRVADLHVSETTGLAGMMMWEIGADGSDVRLLRSRLDLDSGYLSRLLRSLENDELVTVEQSATDGRVRAAHLTDRGRAERAELDRRSDDLAASILQPLSASQRARLIAAMAEVERLLLASTVRVAVCDPRHPHARSCMQAYFSELSHRFDGGFEPDRAKPVDDQEITAPAGLLLVATLYGEPVGCGALKFHHDAPAEIKRLWVAPTVRGLGLGRRLLTELEEHAAARRVRTVRLDTNRALHEAINMYRAAGYREIAAFNDETYAHHWFEKDLDRSGATTSVRR